MLQEIIEKKKETREPKIIFKGSDNRKRAVKNGSYLLTVIREGDEDCPLIKEFLSSLPDEAEIILDSFGYVGNLANYTSKKATGYDPNSLQEDRRHFVIFQTSNIEELVLDYFKSTQKASAHIIPDKLLLDVVYMGWDNLFLKRYVFGQRHTGSINGILSFSEELSSIPTEKLVRDTINDSKQALEQLTRKKWLGLSNKRKLPPTYAFMGIETPDREYLIKVSSKGPVQGEIG